MGLSVWCEDEAGPYQTKPYAGARWQLEAHPVQLPHAYVRDGTAKTLTLFHPASGQLRLKGVTSAPNAVLHSWLKQELTAILAHLPEPTSSVTTRPTGHSGSAGGKECASSPPFEQRLAAAADATRPR